MQTFALKPLFANTLLLGNELGCGVFSFLATSAPFLNEESFAWIETFHTIENSFDCYNDLQKAFEGFVYFFQTYIHNKTMVNSNVLLYKVEIVLNSSNVFQKIHETHQQKTYLLRTTFFSGYKNKYSLKICNLLV